VQRLYLMISGDKSMTQMGLLMVGWSYANLAVLAQS